MTTQPKQAMIKIGAQDSASIVIKKLEGEVERLNHTLRNTKAANDTFTSSVGTGRNMARNYRYAMSQMGYQLQDVAVQLQGGTKAIQVFTQQGSQMAMVFGAHGAIIGAVIAIGGAIAGALLPSLMRSGEEIDKVALATERLNEVFAEAELSTRALSKEMEELAGKSKTAFERQIGNSIYLTVDALEAARKESNKLFDDTFGTKSLKAAGQFRGAIMDDVFQPLSAVIDQLELDPSKSNEFAALRRTYIPMLQEIAEQYGINEDQADHLIRAQMQLEQGFISPDRFQEVIDGMAGSSREFNEYAQGMSTVTDQIEFLEQRLIALKAALNGDVTFEETEEKKGDGKPEKTPWVPLIPDDVYAQYSAYSQYRVEAEKYAEANVKAWRQQRNDELRREWLNNQNQPWMVGVPDPENVKAWLERVDAELLAQHEREMALINERRNAYMQLGASIAGIFEQASANQRATLEADARYGENLSDQELAAKERAAKSAFENEKKWAIAGVAFNTGVAAMKALATEDPFTKWTSFAAVLGAGVKQAQAIEGRQFNSGAFSPNTAAPPIASTTNNNVQSNVTIQVNGGNPQSVVKALQQYLSSSDAILFTKDSAQGRALNG